VLTHATSVVGYINLIIEDWELNLSIRGTKWERGDRILERRRLEQEQGEENVPKKDVGPQAMERERGNKQ